MSMEITFPGGFGVNASFKGFTVATDQTTAHGGGGSAPEPFDLFLASIGTCAGFYALRFCQERSIPTEGLALTLSTERDVERKRVSTIVLEVTLPDGFPEKYRSALLRSIDQCAVKRHVVDPPRFDVMITADARVAAVA